MLAIALSLSSPLSCCLAFKALRPTMWQQLSVCCIISALRLICVLNMCKQVKTNPTTPHTQTHTHQPHSQFHIYLSPSLAGISYIISCTGCQLTAGRRALTAPRQLNRARWFMKFWKLLHIKYADIFAYLYMQIYLYICKFVYVCSWVSVWDRWKLYKAYFAAQLKIWHRQPY